LYPVAPLEAVHDSETLDVVVPVTASPVGVGGGEVPPEPVVADTAADFADSPAEFVALTEKLYVVLALSPETVALVPPTDVTLVVPWYTSYPVAPLDAVHDRETLDDVVPVTVSPVGAGGGVTVPPDPVSDTSSAK